MTAYVGKSNISTILTTYKAFVSYFKEAEINGRKGKELDKILKIDKIIIRNSKIIPWETNRHWNGIVVLICVIVSANEEHTLH